MTAMLTRLEYLGPRGWKTVGEYPLEHPERFAARLAAKKKFGRATVLSTGRTFVTPGVPRDPNVLRPTTEGFWPWKMPSPEKCCPICDVEHDRPFDGRCLL